MDLLEFVVRISQDADPLREGFQPHASYVILNIAVPVLVGVVVGWGLGAIESMLHLGAPRGQH